jgi:hypothetical protein
MQCSSAFQIGTILLATVMLAGHAAAQDCVEPPDGLISWWPGDGNADDIWAGHSGTILGGMGFAPGMVGDAFSADGIDDGVEVPNTGGVFDVTRFTVTAWVFPNSADGGRPIMWKQSRVGNFNTFDVNWETGLDVGRLACPAEGCVFSMHIERASDDRDFGMFSEVAHLPGQWFHVAFVYDGNDQIIYVDGVEEGRNRIGFVVPYASGDPLWIGNAEQTNRGRVTFPVFDGLLDEVALFNRGLSGDDVRAIFDAGSAGMCQPLPPPTIDELVQRIEDLEAAVDELSDHTHTYRTGRGRGHNNTGAETGLPKTPLE